MLGTSTPFAITATLNTNLPYDPAGISRRSRSPRTRRSCCCAPRAADPLGGRSRQGREGEPGRLSYGSAGPGSPQHLSFELLKDLTGINVVHVPHRGDAPALTNLVAGHIPMMFAEPTPVLPLLGDGKVRALAVSSPTRLPIMPEIPRSMRRACPASTSRPGR